MLELARRAALIEAAIASLAVSAAVATVAAAAPHRHAGTGVGLTFLAAVWWLVWRHDDVRVAASGLSVGGLVSGPPPRARALARDGLRALAWALVTATIAFVPFYFGWRTWWHPRAAFHLAVAPYETLNLVAGQLMLVALPEEAFYRGYLQSRFDEALPPQWLVLGARVGPGLLITSAVFALGHLLTVRDPARLAVFFPSLVFGWLRARTGGVGASIGFHVLCNLFSEALGRGYGLY